MQSAQDCMCDNVSEARVKQTRISTALIRLLTRPAKKIFPCPFDRFDKISLRERALTNV